MIDSFAFHMLVLHLQTKEYTLIHSPDVQENKLKPTKILLALSGLKEALTNNPGYNRRVAECQEAASILLQ